jgi:hypothetical protein
MVLPVPALERPSWNSAARSRSSTDAAIWTPCSRSIATSCGGSRSGFAPRRWSTRSSTWRIRTMAATIEGESTNAKTPGQASRKTAILLDEFARVLKAKRSISPQPTRPPVVFSTRRQVDRILSSPESSSRPSRHPRSEDNHPALRASPAEGQGRIRHRGRGQGDLDLALA